MKTKRQQTRLWSKYRAAILMAEPLCRSCLAEGIVTGAEELDHIVPLWKGGDHSLTNLQPLCSICHRLKSRQEARERAPAAADRRPEAWQTLVQSLRP